MKPAWFVLILLLAACGSADPKQQVNSENGAGLPSTDLNRVTEGVPAPDFTLESINDDRITLSGYRGKKNVVLVFYRGYW